MQACSSSCVRQIEEQEKLLDNLKTEIQELESRSKELAQEQHPGNVS